MGDFGLVSHSHIYFAFCLFYAYFLKGFLSDQRKKTYGPDRIRSSADVKSALCSDILVFIKLSLLPMRCFFGISLFLAVKLTTCLCV